MERSELHDSTVFFTADVADIRDANFYIIVVSTPAIFYELPNLHPLIEATKMVGGLLRCCI